MPYNHPGITARLVRTYVGVCIIRNTSLQLTIVISSFYVHDIHIALVGAGYLNQIEQGQDYIKSIMGNYEPIPDVNGMEDDTPATNGMNVLCNVMNIESGKSSNVIIRSITEKFWLQVIEATKRHRVCALGTPGIGKTTTTCILIRLLLKQNKTVVYQICGTKNDSFVYMFTPRMDSLGEVVNVKVIEEQNFKYWDTNVNQKNIYYIVDPGKTTDNCDLNSDFKGKVIIVTSPDERHWGESEFDKLRDSGNDEESGGTQGIFLYYPVWTLSELLASVPYVTANRHFNVSDVKARFDRFGGVPRYIFSADIDSEIIKQNICLEKLNDNTAVSLAHRKRTAIKSSSEDLPKGMLLSYVLMSKKNQTFREGFAVFSSEYVYNWIVNKFKFQLWKEMVRDELDFDTYLYEAYVRKLFYSNSPCQEPQEYKIMNCVGKTGDRTVKTTCLGGCKEVTKVDDILQSAAKLSNIVFTPFSTQNKLIDFIYSIDDCMTFNCFQCTISNTHDAQQSLIFDLVKTLMEIRSNKAKLPRIQLFYCVPRGKFSTFATKPVNASNAAQGYCKEKTGERSEIYRKWHEILSISILCIDPPKDSNS